MAISQISTNSGRKLNIVLATAVTKIPFKINQNTPFRVKIPFFRPRPLVGGEGYPFPNPLLASPNKPSVFSGASPRIPTRSTLLLICLFTYFLFVYSFNLIVILLGTFYGAIAVPSVTRCRCCRRRRRCCGHRCAGGVRQ